MHICIQQMSIYKYSLKSHYGQWDFNIQLQVIT